MRGYCAAVRAALTDDGRPPLEASGLKLHDRLRRIATSLDQVAARAGNTLLRGLSRLRQPLRRGLEETATLFPAVRESTRRSPVCGRGHPQERREGLPAKKVRRRLVQLLVRMRRAAAMTGEPSVRAGLKQFLKVTKSYWPGLFGCYDVRGGPAADEQHLEHTFGSHRYHEPLGQRPAMGIAGLGGDGVGAADFGVGDAVAAGGGHWCWGRAMSRTGRADERSWSSGANRGASSGGSATIPPPISRSWSNSASS